MARLSKHGAELYRFDTLTARVSIRSDRQIMRDNGCGWKLWKRLKDTADPAAYAARQRERRAGMDADRPCYAAFRDLFHELVSFKHRQHVLTAIELLPDDPDGLCVEIQDCPSFRYASSSPELDLDDCVKLCEAFRAAREEIAELADPTNAIRQALVDARAAIAKATS